MTPLGEDDTVDECHSTHCTTVSSVRQNFSTEILKTRNKKIIDRCFPPKKYCCFCFQNYIFIYKHNITHYGLLPMNITSIIMTLLLFFLVQKCIYYIHTEKSGKIYKCIVGSGLHRFICNLQK
jgi:hypothetical protein